MSTNHLLTYSDTKSNFDVARAGSTNAYGVPYGKKSQ